MGDYARVQVLLAESDFDPEEQGFMARLWRDVYGPGRSIDWTTPGAYQERQARREKIHAEMKLPGTTWDWQSLLTRELDGRHYYKLLDSLSPSVIPPFPRRFADSYGLHHKYGIRPTWYALFSRPDCEGDSSSYLTTIGSARRQFAENFREIWRLTFCAQSEDHFVALTRSAPPGSAEKTLVERVFERFPFEHYRSVLELLSCDWGRDALIELDFGSILYNYDVDHNRAVAMVQEECASASRVFEALRRLDIAALRGEVLFQSQESYRNSGPVPWLAPYEDQKSVYRFQQYLFETWD